MLQVKIGSENFIVPEGDFVLLLGILTKAKIPGYGKWKHLGFEV